jgi:hypothetical protein
MLKFKFYTDPGHGWLAVKLDLVREYTKPGEVSGYSYLKGKTVYLEEDMDAHLFLSRLTDAGVPYELVFKSTDKPSPIRTYARFTDVA